MERKKPLTKKAVPVSYTGSKKRVFRFVDNEALCKNGILTGNWKLKPLAKNKVVLWTIYGAKKDEKYILKWEW